MKKLALISTIFFIASGVFAQEKKDTTTIYFGNSKILIVSDNEKVSIENNDTITIEDDDTMHVKKNKFNGHWAGVDVGLNGYMYNNNSMSLTGTDRSLSLNQAKSWNISLNFAEVNMKLVKNYIGITTGLGLQFNNYRFDKSIKLISDSASLTYFNDTIKYNKNKLIVTYLTLPILFDFQIPVGEHDRIHLTAGVVGGLRIGTHTKQVFDLNGNENKEKQREDFHLSPFQYGLTARLGYNGVGVFVNYSLSSLFKDGEGPELYPWSAGLSFSF